MVGFGILLEGRADGFAGRLGVGVREVKDDTRNFCSQWGLPFVKKGRLLGEQVVK